MAENLTEEVFAQNLNTKFRVRAEAPRPVELELVEVKGWTTREPRSSKSNPLCSESGCFHGRQSGGDSGVQVGP